MYTPTPLVIRGRACPRCQGTGEANSGACPQCNGTGRYASPARWIAIWIALAAAVGAAIYLALC